MKARKRKPDLQSVSILYNVQRVPNTPKTVAMFHLTKINVPSEEDIVLLADPTARLLSPLWIVAPPCVSVSICPYFVLREHDGYFSMAHRQRQCALFCGGATLP